MSDGLDPLERLLAERARERLVNRFARLLDLGREEQRTELAFARRSPTPS